MFFVGSPFSIHTIIPKHELLSSIHAFALETHQRSAILTARSVAFGSAECDDRQGQIGLGATAATGVASSGGFDPGSLLLLAADGTGPAGASSTAMIFCTRAALSGANWPARAPRGDPCFRSQMALSRHFASVYCCA